MCLHDIVCIAFILIECDDNTRSYMYNYVTYYIVSICTSPVLTWLTVLNGPFRFQREERETLNQLARRLATGSHAGLMGGHATSMIQHLVYRHPNAMASSDQIVMPMSSRRSAVVDSPPGSSRSGDTPLGHEYPSENESSLLSRKGEAQSWTFEEQFRQVSRRFST
jgi:hypothetical protein